MRWTNILWFRFTAGFVGVTCATILAAQPPAADKYPLPSPPPKTILKQDEFPIDLGTALKMAGVENPELLLARTRIAEAVAERQLAVTRNCSPT